MKKIDFVELMSQLKERHIPWCNMSCKAASINDRRYYWSGKHCDLGTMINALNKSEIMFECLCISKNKRIKEISAMGYEIEQVCEVFGSCDKLSKVYFIAKKRNCKIA